MTIYEYKLDATAEGMMCPTWIDDGGYFGNGNKLVGVTRDNPEFHVPSTVISFTPAELEVRQLAIHAITPMMKEGATLDDDDRIEMTATEVSTRVQAWVTSK